MGKIFLSAKKYNPNPGKYSWDNWNRAIENSDENAIKIVGNLTKGNFYNFITVLLGMEWIGGEWQMKRPTMKCKRL